MWTVQCLIRTRARNQRERVTARARARVRTNPRPYAHDSRMDPVPIPRTSAATGTSSHMTLRRKRDWKRSGNSPRYVSDRPHHAHPSLHADNSWKREFAPLDQCAGTPMIPFTPRPKARERPRGPTLRLDSQPAVGLRAPRRGAAATTIATTKVAHKVTMAHRPRTTRHAHPHRRRWRQQRLTTSTRRWQQRRTTTARAISWQCVMECHLLRRWRWSTKA